MHKLLNNMIATFTGQLNIAILYVNVNIFLFYFTALIYVVL